MIRFIQGDLLQADTEALVNTVNTVGVMGKGIALMFKEAFPENYRLYAEACKQGQVRIGEMFVTENNDLFGPKWIINFPTKQHWRNPSKIGWIRDGLHNLTRVVQERSIKSLALPPLGCGNGGLSWPEVRKLIESMLEPLTETEVMVYEPAGKYMGLPKRSGVEELTPARALVTEAVRRYWVLGFPCSNLEVHKLAWFLQRSIQMKGLDNPLNLRFTADRYGPYADNLRHLLDRLDGSYLKAEKRLSDAGPMDIIWFDGKYREKMNTYLESGKFAYYEPVLELVTCLIDGFQSAFGLELLATIDWLLVKEHTEARPEKIREALQHWPGGRSAGERKLRIFNERHIELGLARVLEVFKPVLVH
jgi:O-acetyl-ADP-ribose deacetylase (regulator of RNase III)